MIMFQSMQYEFKKWPGYRQAMLKRLQVWKWMHELHKLGENVVQIIISRTN